MSEDDVLLLSEARQATKDGRARAVREEHNLSQEEMAQGSGVSKQTITLWEAGKRRPTGEGALRYARLLHRLGLRPAQNPAA